MLTVITASGKPGPTRRNMPTPAKNRSTAPIAPPRATCKTVVSIWVQCAQAEGLSTFAAVAQLFEIGQTFAELSFKPPLHRRIILRALHALWEVILTGKPIFRIVIIGISVAIALILHQTSRGI